MGSIVRQTEGNGYFSTSQRRAGGASVQGDNTINVQLYCTQLPGDILGSV